jgi:hypothetical protein
MPPGVPVLVVDGNALTPLPQDPILPGNNT